MLTVHTPANFYHSGGPNFLLQTRIGNFVWSSPDYPDGDNKIRKFNGTYQQWCRQEGISYGKDKGTHIIGTYCGQDVIISNTEINP